MCRHLAFLGPPTTLARLLLEPRHSLLRQSWAPHDMRCAATINADGFGVGWYADDNAEGQPLRYRRSSPMWTDADFAELARSVTSTAVLAAVRSATVGMPVIETACAPFVHDRWLFSHNGVIDGWPDSVTALAAALPTRDLLTLDAPTDAALLWALVWDRLRRNESPATALSTVVSAVATAAPDSRLNLLLTDGESITATAYGHALSTLDTGDAIAVASEPYDDDQNWREVPEGSLVSAKPGAVTVRSIERKAA